MTVAITWLDKFFANALVLDDSAGTVDGQPLYYDAATGKWTPQAVDYVWSGGTDADTHPLPTVHATRAGKQTTDATANVVVATYPNPPDGTEVRVVVECLAKRTDVVGDAAWFSLRAVWLYTGGAYVVVHAPEVVSSDHTAGAAAWVAGLSASGASGIQVKVTGEAGKTITWKTVRESIEAI